MNFAEAMERCAFAHSIDSSHDIARKLWNDCAHITISQTPSGHPAMLVVAHNIDNFAAVYNPGVEDICAEDWEEYAPTPVIALA